MLNRTNWMRSFIDRFLVFSQTLRPTEFSPGTRSEQTGFGFATYSDTLNAETSVIFQGEMSTRLRMPAGLSVVISLVVGLLILRTVYWLPRWLPSRSFPLQGQVGLFKSSVLWQSHKCLFYTQARTILITCNNKSRKLRLGA